MTLGAGESAEFEIRAGVDPERVLGDPDVLVLQLRCDEAVFDLLTTPPPTRFSRFESSLDHRKQSIIGRLRERHA